MPSRTSLAGGEEQCRVSKLQATGYLAGTVLEHCHCVKMPGRNQYAGEKTDRGVSFTESITAWSSGPEDAARFRLARI